MGRLECSRVVIKTQLHSKYSRVSSNNKGLQVQHPWLHHRLGKFHFPWVHKLQDPSFKILLIYLRCKRN
uniref:Uncharacterized protein n=1 Tax=Rhizophora mucronata TaxID=61149 RepID=A0A2P2LWB1_RHIMU